jgi:hypothetical protein
MVKDRKEYNVVLVKTIAVKNQVACATLHLQYAYKKICKLYDNSICNWYSYPPNFSFLLLWSVTNKQKMFNSTCEKSVLQIKQDDKFFSRLLSKENSNTNPSFRVSVAVPFVWESQPGTPKYTFSKDTIPPLTPPPSYHFKNSNKKNEKKHSKSTNPFLALLQKLNLKKTNQSSSSLSSLSSLSSSYPPCLSSSSMDSSKITSATRRVSRRRFLSFGSSFDFRGENEEDGNGSPNSTLCFGIHRSTSNIGFQSKYKRRA